VTLTTAISGQFVIGRLGHAMVNLPTKFEFFAYTRYNDMKGIKMHKMEVVWGG